jgi:uncharacterized membrane protein
VARLVALVGLTTTTLTIGISLLPPPDESNKFLAVFKIVGLSGLLVLMGVAIFYGPKIRQRLAGPANKIS